MSTADHNGAAGPGEYMIAKILRQRLDEEQTLISSERGSIAYRISEIMVCAKDLYTQALPRLLKEAPGESTLEEEIAGLRMTLLHLRDLVGDFDNAFLEAMHHERKAKPGEVYADWKPMDDEEWTPEELGLGPEEVDE